jgi:putative oxidoreductase
MITIFLIGRVLFGGYFLYNAYNHLVHTKALAGYARFKGVPMPTLAVFGSGLLLLIGGYAMLTGMHTTLGAWALVLFLVPVTFQMHAFWNESGEARQTQQIMFGKNVALLGAALMTLAISTPWLATFGI